MEKPIYNGGREIIKGPKEFSVSFEVDLSWQCPICGMNGSEGMTCGNCQVPLKKGIGLAGGIDRIIHPERYEE